MGDVADRVRYEMTGGKVRTEILGNNRLILEGCDGVIAYGPERTGFRCGRQQVWISGKNLRILRMEENDTVISGKIEVVEFQ